LVPAADGWRKTMDSSWTTGHHKGVSGALRWIKSKHDYTRGDASTQFMDGKPKDTEDVGSCFNWANGLEAGGVKPTVGARSCPDEISTNVKDQFYMHGWFGRAAKDGTYVGSLGHSLMRVRKEDRMGFRWQIRALESDCYYTPIPTVITNKYDGSYWR
jgi:hypothetical protein